MYLQTSGDDVLGHNSMAKEVHLESKDAGSHSMSWLSLSDSGHSVAYNFATSVT